MTTGPHSLLTRRERQIMDAIYSAGRLTAGEVREAMPDPPGYSAVRAMLATLERKGHVRHSIDGLRYVYAPAVPKGKATRSAVRYLLRTFFEGSAGDAVAALLDVSAGKLTDVDLDRMALMIERARKEGR